MERVGPRGGGVAFALRIEIGMAFFLLFYYYYFILFF